MKGNGKFAHSQNGTLSGYQQIREWLLQKLPSFNLWAENREIGPQEFASEMNNQVAPFFDPYINNVEGLSEKECRKLLQAIGFLVSSLERACRMSDLPNGTCFDLLPLGVEAFMIRLGQKTGLPPRDSHITYWLENQDIEPITFTGDDQERFFLKRVLETQRLTEASNQLLRPICDRGFGKDLYEEQKILCAVSENIHELHKQYKRFMGPHPDRTGRNMEPLFFATRFRTYLLSYPLGGVERTGPNAANIQGQPSLDFLLGTSDFNYEITVKNRFGNMSIAEVAALQEDIRRPSLPFWVANLLGEQWHKFAFLSNEEVCRRINALNFDVTPILRELLQVWKLWSRLSAIHWALIQNYLVKVPIDQEEKKKLVVSPDAGTGNSSHQDTFEIFKMRKESAFYLKLSSALTQMSDKATA